MPAPCLAHAATFQYHVLDACLSELAAQRKAGLARAYHHHVNGFCQG